MQNESNIFDWIPVGPGINLPDYDDPVLWRREDGNFFVRSIDKDDNAAWWNGENYCGNTLYGCFRYTHWCKIISPVNY